MIDKTDEEAKSRQKRKRKKRGKEMMHCTKWKSLTDTYDALHKMEILAIIPSSFIGLLTTRRQPHCRSFPLFKVL